MRQSMQDLQISRGEQPGLTRSSVYLLQPPPSTTFDFHFGTGISVTAKSTFIRLDCRRSRRGSAKRKQLRREWDLARASRSQQSADIWFARTSKRLKEEEDAARAYKEFVASFDDPSDSNGQGARGHKTFVRAGGSGTFPSIGFSSVTKVMKLTSVALPRLQPHQASRRLLAHQTPAMASSHLAQVAREHRMAAHQCCQQDRVH